MLIVESHVDVPTVVDGKESPMSEFHCNLFSPKPQATTDHLTGIFVFTPTVPQYPNA